ncbi:MAG: Hsp70 family protein [Pseudomonadota bacterium]
MAQQSEVVVKEIARATIVLQWVLKRSIEWDFFTMDRVVQALVCFLVVGQSRYIIGIDLGTTNSAMAYADLADSAEVPTVRLFEVPQLVGVATWASRPGLPSFLYLPGAHDLPSGATALPWVSNRDYVVGDFAREQGALIPGRLVLSAKSWLCHNGVDRESDILPWGSSSEVPHLSPVEVSARYLQHFREAWDHKMSEGRSEWSMAQCEVVLTVPASFDEVARKLTVRAAHLAGLQRLTLLEEPQAAFYSWIRSQGEDWKEQLTDGDLVLVCDVGGGTTDFSLIVVRGSGAKMTLERVAVGDHLMLGGDNMDLALARHLERRLVKRAGELNARQWGALIHGCRRAKEALLNPRGDDRYTITIAGTGSKVIGGSLKIDLFRDEVEGIVLDSFFPLVGFDEPALQSTSRLQEPGLPYATEKAITRNMAAFLQRHKAKPNAVLFNGGAMKAMLVQDRVVETFATWFGGEPDVLESQSLDMAVALGAATYGLARAGVGVRIRGGTARAYYVGVEHDSDEAEKGVCLIPFGVEEGGEVQIEDRVFELVTDRPVSFPFYSSTAPLGHDAGEVAKIDKQLFVELPSVHTVLNYERGASNQTVPVKLGACLTELGTLQLFCASQSSDHRWDLEFSVRGENAEDREQTGLTVGDSSVEIEQGVQTEAAEEIRQTFEGRSKEGPRALIKRLEVVLGADRFRWPGDVIRVLWEPIWESANQRKAGPEYEAAWFNLSGILLRPGFGDPLDSRRIEQLWDVFREGIVHSDDLWCRIGWWILWRRVSGGLDRGRQLELSNRLAPPLLTGAALKAAGVHKGGTGKQGKGKKGQKGKTGDEGLNRQELAEMWRAVASLERIPAPSKEGLGDVAMRNAAQGRGDFAFWALGRIGARVPLYGPINEVVRRVKVEGWLDRIMGLDWSKYKGVVLAAVQMARLCGSEDRDIDEKLRTALITRLKENNCADQLLKMVSEITVLKEQEKAQFFGDALPAGLRMKTD